jgi:uncharacterized protein (TIRG00374 family)
VAETKGRGRRSLWKYLLSILLTAGFLWLAFRGTDAEKLWSSLRSADYRWVVAYVILLFVSHLARAVRWRYLLEPVKGGIGVRNLFSSVMIGYMVNNLLPRAGEIARPYAIGKLENLSKSAALGTIVVERIMDTFSFLILIVAIPLVYHGPVAKAFPWLHGAGVVLALVTAGLVAVLVAMMVRRDWTTKVLRIAGGVLPAKFARRLERIGHSFLDGFLFLTRPGRFFVVGILSVLVWSLYALMTYTALFAFGLQDSVGLGGAVVLLTIASIGVAIPTPGATGSYHMFASQTLVRLFGVDQELALSFATVTHAAGFVSITLAGLLYLLRDHITVSEAMKEPANP